MRGFLRNNGLTLAMFGLFAAALLGQSVTGWRSYDEDRRAHGEATIGFGGYLRTGHFVEAVFENWESEFLQMGGYVLLTAVLFQKGSAESKDPDGGEADPVDEDPREARGRPDAPWPVRRGGVALRIYEHSLTIALFALFVLAFALHAAGGARAYGEEQVAHGGRRRRRSPSWGPHSSGSSRSRTGRASSCRSRCWSCSRSSSASAARRSRNRWRRRTRRPGGRRALTPAPSPVWTWERGEL